MALNKQKAQEREAKRLAWQTPTITPPVPTPVPTPEPAVPATPAFNPVNWAPVSQPAQPTPTPEAPQVSNGEDTTAFNQQVQATATPAQPPPTQSVTQPTPNPEMPVANTSTTNVTPTKETTTSDQITLEREKIRLQNEAQTLKNKEEAKARQADRDMQNGLIAQDENAIYGMIATWAMIPASVKTSPYYKKAQDTFNKVQQYSTLTPIQLLSAVDNGQLVPWTAVYNQLLKDPATKAKMAEVAKYTSTTPLNYDKVTESASSTILSNNPTTAQALADGFISVDEYEKITNTPAVLAKLNEVQEKNSAYNNAKFEIEQAVEKAKQDFAGSPFLQWIIDDIRTAGQPRLSLLRSEADNALWVYTELKSDSASLFETNLAQYNKELATKTAREQAIFSQQLQNGDINSTDPFIKQRGVENAVEQIVGSIATQRPKAQIVADIMASGDIMGSLAQLQKDIQAKPEYQRQQEIKNSQLTDIEKLTFQAQLAEKSDVRNFNQQLQLAKYNNDNDRENFLFEIQNDPDKYQKWLDIQTRLEWDKSLYDVLGKNVGTYEGNRGYDLAGSLWDPLPAGGNWKVKSVSTWAPLWVPYKPWTVSPYGNTVVMEDENGNEIRYSHLTNVWVKAWDVLWFGDIVGTRGNTGNVVWKNGEKLTNAQLLAWRWAHVDIEIKDKSGKLLSNAEQVEYLKNTKKSTGSLVILGQFMKDNQDRGTWYSNDDVKAFNEKIDRLTKEWDINGMAIAYRNMVMKDKDFKKEFDDTTVFVRALDDVEKMINDYEQAGKSTNALKAMAEKVGRKLWVTQDEALARLQTQLWVTMANYIRSISGTAASDVEVQRLMWNMANIGNVKELNTAIVWQVRSNGVNGLKQMIDNRMYGMPEELKPQVFWDIYTKPTTQSTTTTTIAPEVQSAYDKYLIAKWYK